MKRIPFFVGSYTQPESHVPKAKGKGIYTCVIDLENGSLEKLHTSAKILNPSYLDYDARGNILFASSENTEKPGEVASYAVSKKYKLKRLSSAPTSGRASCHVLYNKGNLYATSYFDGKLDVFSVDEGIINPQQSIVFEGSGPNKSRQESAHAHQTVISPDQKYLYVCDLGADKVWRHKLRAKLSKSKKYTELSPGSGPRHMVFHPVLPFAYIVAELTAFVHVAKYDKGSGSLTVINEISTLPPDFKGLPSSAAIRLHPTGKALYISNRQHNSFSAYKIDKKGKLHFMDRLPSGGKEPRDLQVDPTGNFLLIANQDDNNISVYKLDKKSGRPIPGIVHVLKCNTPVCIVFAN